MFRWQWGDLSKTDCILTKAKQCMNLLYNFNAPCSSSWCYDLDIKYSDIRKCAVLTAIFESLSSLFLYLIFFYYMHRWRQNLDKYVTIHEHIANKQRINLFILRPDSITSTVTLTSFVDTSHTYAYLITSVDPIIITTKSLQRLNSYKFHYIIGISETELHSWSHK